MNKAKKIMAVILAIFIVAGVMSPLLYITAKAAGLDVGSATETGKIEIIRGTPDPNVFNEPGIYQFSVTKGLKLTFRNLTVGSKPNEVSIPSNASSITVGGLTMRPADDSPWVEGFEFKISIVKADSSKPSKDPGVKYTASYSSIRKGSSLYNLTFDVTDYNTLKTEVDAATAKPVISSYRSEAFPYKASKEGTATLKADAAGIYAVFQVTLPVVYSGKGKAVSFDISFQDKFNEGRVVTCIYDVPNTVETVPDKDEDDKDVVTDPLTPYIIVESYSYGGDSVLAGNDFELVLTLRNTSESHTLENIVMNIAPMGVFSMGSSSNTIYIDQLFAGSTIRKVVTLNTGLTKVTDDKDANSINMKFEFQYLVDKTRKSGTSNESITIPVNFPDRFEVSMPNLPDEGYEGSECYIYVPMLNKGRSSVYNVTASIKSNDLQSPVADQFLGNVNAGSETSAEFSLLFEGSGAKSGEIIISYEDTNMNPKEVSLPFTISVQESVRPEPMPDPGEMPGGPDVPVEVEKKMDAKYIAALFVAILVCAMSTYLTIQKAKAKRSIFVDEEI